MRVLPPLVPRTSLVPKSVIPKGVGVELALRLNEPFQLSAVLKNAATLRAALDGHPVALDAAEQGCALGTSKIIYHHILYIYINNTNTILSWHELR